MPGSLSPKQRESVMRMFGLAAPEAASGRRRYGVAAQPLGDTALEGRSFSLLPGLSPIELDNAGALAKELLPVLLGPGEMIGLLVKPPLRAVSNYPV